MGQAFYSVYGAKNPILRPVYATQMGQTYYVSLVLGMIKEAFGEPSDYLYALAQAPYWSGDNTIDGLTKAQELANAAANLATLPVPERAFAAWATDWGLKSVTYEGGPGMSGTPSLEAKIKANTSPDMGTLVSQSLRMAVSNDAQPVHVLQRCRRLRPVWHVGPDAGCVRSGNAEAEGAGSGDGRRHGNFGGGIGRACDDCRWLSGFCATVASTL